MRIRKVHGFVNCVGLIDGTLFPLAFAPTVNGEEYYTRKLNMLLKGWSFVMMLQGLPGLKWDGWVVSMTIKFGQK